MFPTHLGITVHDTRVTASYSLHVLTFVFHRVAAGSTTKNLPLAEAVSQLRPNCRWRYYPELLLIKPSRLSVVPFTRTQPFPFTRSRACENLSKWRSWSPWLRCSWQAIRKPGQPFVTGDVSCLRSIEPVTDVGAYPAQITGEPLMPPRSGATRPDARSCTLDVIRNF